MFVQSPLEPAEQVSRSRSSVPVQMSMLPRVGAPEAAAAAPSRQPWAFIAGASMIGLLLVAAFVRVNQQPSASTAPAMHNEELTAIAPPIAPAPPATPIRKAEPESVGIRTSDLAKSDPTPPQRTANSAPSRLRPSLVAVPAKSPRVATVSPAPNIYDIELHDTRKAPRTIDEVNPY